MKVLFADEKKNWHMLVDMVLEKRNIDVEHAYTVNEAVNKISAGNLDFAILDVSLRDGTAYDVLKQVKPKVPVIVIGHLKEGFDETRINSLGAIALKKPFTVEELLKVLKQQEVLSVPSLTLEPSEEASLSLDLQPVQEVSPQELSLEIQPIQPELTLQPQEIQPEPIELQPPPETLQSQELQPQPVSGAASRKVSDVSVNKDEVKAKLEEVIREVVWEVVPELAEKVIREEIEKLIKSRLA